MVAVVEKERGGEGRVRERDDDKEGIEGFLEKRRGVLENV